MKRALAPSLVMLALGMPVLGSAGVCAADRPALAAKPGETGQIPGIQVPVAHPPATQVPFLSELRLGLFSHDPWSPERGSADFSAEVLFQKPFIATSSWEPAIPRLHLGGALNTDGKTSHLRAGLSWTFELTEKLFVEASLGGALHNGRTSRAVPANRNSLGCSAHFREAAGIGYRIDPRWSVIASVEHLSNAGLCRKNRGLTNLGVSLGYRF